MKTPQRPSLHLSRRQFALAALAPLGLLARLPQLSAADVQLPADAVRFDPSIEPLVQLLENTPRDRIIEIVAHRVQRGLAYRELVCALFLAGIRNIQPRPIGFKFHAVLVVHAAHLAALASPDSDRWLPIFWAIDLFKNSQDEDARKADWTLRAAPSAPLPPSHLARKAFVDAMDSWDEPAADAAIVRLVQHTPPQEIFELLCRYGVRDFREIGHKQTYISSSFRLLELVGWRHAEPVLRGVVYGLLDRVGDPNPSQSDLPADRPFRRNLEALSQIQTDAGVSDLDASQMRDALESFRDGSAIDTSQQVIRLLNRSVSPTRVFDLLHTATAELIQRSPGIFSLHAATFTNAVQYAWRHSHDPATRRLLLLQNAAFLPLFRGQPKTATLRIHDLESVDPSQGASASLDSIFASIGKDSPSAARSLFAWLRSNPDPSPFAQAARRLVFLKGRDAHDYKFSSALFEDYPQVSAPWRPHVIASSVYLLRGASESDNPLIHRIRSALAG